MDKFTNDIKKIPEVDFPEGLHGKIMRQLYFLRFKTPFIAVMSVLSFNLLLSAWNVWVRLADVEIVSVFGSLFQGFEISLEFASDFFQAITDYLPVRSMSIFAVNLLLIGYMAYLFIQLRRCGMQKVGKN